MGVIRNITNYYKALHIYPKFFVTTGLLIVFMLSLYVITEFLSSPDKIRIDLLTDGALLTFSLIILGGLILLPFLLCAVITSIEKNKRPIFIPLLSIISAFILFEIYFIFFIYPKLRGMGGVVIFIIPLAVTFLVLFLWGIYRLVSLVATAKRKNE